MAAESISLYFSEGSSDKEYHAELVASGEGFLVNFRFGRRGSTLTTGTKTAEPIAFAKAKAVYDKLVLEKVRKGYTPGETGKAYQATTLEERFTGVVPQLLNAIDRDALEALLDDALFGAQEKKDGKRCLIRKSTAGVEGINRRGLTIALPKTLEADVQSLVAKELLLDGELIGEQFFVFDVLEIDGTDLRTRAYLDRYGGLSDVMRTKLEHMSLLELAQTPAAKRELLATVVKQGGEGIVLKRLDAPYVAGRPASGGAQRKFKLTASASCRVANRNGTKRSVALELMDEGKWIGVGNVTIPANVDIPEQGALVEIEYLYAFKGGSLFQPVYRGERDDLEEAVATVTQLKYKPESADEDES